LTHLGGNPDLRVSLLHGAVDVDVPPECSIQFHEALTAAGYDATITLLDAVGHEIPLPGSPAFDAIVRQTLRVAVAAPALASPANLVERPES
jgi:predicted esterase